MVKGWKKMDKFKDLHRGARAAGCLVKYIDCMIVSFLPSVGCGVMFSNAEQLLEAKLPVF